MPQKKKSKPKKKVVSKSQKPVFEETPKGFDKGFFSRHKDVLPSEQKERTRVKTFIVEKPIIIHEKPQHFTIRGSDEPRGLARIFNSKKSRYAKKKLPSEYEKVPSEDDSDLNEADADSVDLGEEVPEGEEGLTEEEAAAGEEEPIDGESEAELNGEEDLGDEPSGELTDEEFVKKKHARSRGMFINVWWKKAIMWAVLIWVIVLGFELLLQAGNFVQVDLTRQWWFLLGGLIVICMIYFRFIDGKLSI